MDRPNTYGDDLQSQNHRDRKSVAPIACPDRLASGAEMHPDAAHLPVASRLDLGLRPKLSLTGNGFKHRVKPGASLDDVDACAAAFVRTQTRYGLLHSLNLSSLLPGEAFNPVRACDPEDGVLFDGTL
jgi:hypothetical protein